MHNLNQVRQSGLSEIYIVHKAAATTTTTTAAAAGSAARAAADTAAAATVNCPIQLNHMFPGGRGCCCYCHCCCCFRCYCSSGSGNDHDLRRLWIRYDLIQRPQIMAEKIGFGDHDATVGYALVSNRALVLRNRKH